MASETVTTGSDEMREALSRLASVYLDADAAMRRAINKALRTAASPVGIDTLVEASSKFPSRGGLRDSIRSGKATATGALVSRGSVRSSNMNVSIRLTVKGQDGKKFSLGFMNSGTIRHPVFGNRNVWVSQQVPADAFTDAFNEQLPEAQEALYAAINQALDTVASQMNKIA